MLAQSEIKHCSLPRGWLHRLDQAAHDDKSMFEHLDGELTALAKLYSVEIIDQEQEVHSCAACMIEASSLVKRLSLCISCVVHPKCGAETSMSSLFVKVRPSETLEADRA